MSVIALRPRQVLAIIPAALVLLSVPNVARAQAHVHTPGMTHPASDSSPAPRAPGQSAYAAIAEIVRLLDADPSTDWSRVRLEALRAHLVDMDEVTMRAAVRQEDITGGARFTVTGAPRTAAAIRRMARAHGATLAGEGAIDVVVREVPAGVTMTVLARQARDARAVARIRGLGFIGLMTMGEHHAPHHLAIARGGGHGH